MEYLTKLIFKMKTITQVTNKFLFVPPLILKLENQYPYTHIFCIKAILWAFAGVSLKTYDETDKEAMPFLQGHEQGSPAEIPKYLELVCDGSLLNEENDGYEVPRFSMRSMKKENESVQSPPKIKYPSLPLINGDKTANELSAAKKESSSTLNVFMDDQSYTNVDKNAV